MSLDPAVASLVARLANTATAMPIFWKPNGRGGKPSPAWRALGRRAMVVVALAATACQPATESPKPVATTGEWREFQGSWNAAGSRRSISLGGDRRASIIDLRGTMLLAGPGRPGVGFGSEVIALVDSQTGLVGRSVWTDERGDKVYSELKGEGTRREKPHLGNDSGRHGPLCGSHGHL